MKIAGAKNIFRMVLTIFVLLSALSFGVDKADALTCVLPQNIFIAAYEQGVFVDGFVIEYKGTGNLCDIRPVVGGRTENLQDAFSFVSQNLNQPIASGVYQLIKTQCLVNGREEWCMKETTLRQISNNPSELDRYKLEWQQKERDSLRSVTMHLWSVLVIIITLVVIVLVWPWILMGIWPNLRRRSSFFLIIAVLLQAYLALSLKGMFIGSYNYNLWQTTVSISSTVLFLAIIGEIIFIIVKKIRSKNIPI